MLRRTIIAIMTTVSTSAKYKKKMKYIWGIFCTKIGSNHLFLKKKIIGPGQAGLVKKKKELEGIQNHDSLKECMHVKFQYFS